MDQPALDALRATIAKASRKRTDPVFPRYGRDGGGNSASTALGKRLTKVELRDTKAEEVKTTHSLRHNFKEGLVKQTYIANMLQGHTARDAASGYGSSELLEAKRQAAEKVWALIRG